MVYSNRKSSNQHYLRRRLLTSGLEVRWVCGILLLVLGQAYAQGRPDEKVIQTVLDDQVAAWNRGDVEAYMKGYWNSDSTLFVSGGSLTRGYREVLSRYKKNYNTPQKMGKLEFRELTVRLLSASAAVADGIWELKRKSDKPWGRFTLIFEKKNEGWLITQDHTSSAQK